MLKKIAGDAIYLIEHAFVSLAETVRRAWFRLDPRLYAERRRIRSVMEGLTLTASNKFAVFVVYTPTALPEFTMNFIEALNRHSYNVIVVSNTDLTAVTKSKLLRNCCLLIERENVGRDFGGYKDGISIAFRRFRNVGRLIIANDSLYYLTNGLDELVVGLDGPHDFIGVSEVFEHHYHVASFLLSFGPTVLEDRTFHNFWARYLPIPTRMWAIMQGEGALTKELMAAGHRPHILFRAESLLPKLQELSAPEARDALALFPTSVRATLSHIVEQQLLVTKATVDEFAQAAVKEVLERNQMHAAGFAFIKFLGMPLLKRDVVYRGLFPFDETRQIVMRVGGPMQAHIVADLVRRPPPPSRINVLQRLLYRHGYI